MKSVCIKTIDMNQINYLLNSFDDISLVDLVISSYKFKIYNNVIIHYLGKNEEDFIYFISEIISELITDLYQEKIIKKVIKKNYFYLDAEEQNTIFRITKRIIESPNCTIDLKEDVLKKLIYNYFRENKSMILEGFITFRLNEYRKMIDYIIELSVINYLNLSVY